MTIVFALILTFLPPVTGQPPSAIGSYRAMKGVVLEPLGSHQAATAPDSRFVPVEGANLSSRIDTARSRARAAGAERYWVSWRFDVRPGVSIDCDDGDGTRRRTINVGRVSVTEGPGTAETRNAGVFLFYEPNATEPTRLELYNLDRQRDYGGHPVYWLGQATGAESIAVLEQMATTSANERLAEQATGALALHDDAGIGDALERIFRASKSAKAREASLIWTGLATERRDFLANVIRDESERVAHRRQAAIAIGIGKSVPSLPLLRELYFSVRNPEVREHILVAASIGENESQEEAVVDFLIEVAERDTSGEQRKRALFWLGQKASRRGLDTIVEATNDPNDEVREHAVFAISQRPKEEAVPLLIDLARNHENSKVRRQAIFWLGQVDDERALAFFKELFNR